MSTITINLNGGDLVTPDVDLTYKIYGGLDGFTTPIQTYGSANTDADVSVSSGVATLLNANLNGESEVKVTTTDQAGNESFKSNAYSVPSNPFADATLAFSLRDLGLGNVTNVVSVRRSSDNTEQDFTATEITDGTLLDFVGRNLLRNPTRFDLNSAWLMLAGQNVNISRGTGLADPDGGNNAYSFQRVSGSGNYRIRNITAETLTANVDYTFGLWVRVQSGTGDVRIDISDSGITLFTATTTWQYFEITASDSTPSDFVNVRFEDDALTYEVYQPMFNLGSVGLPFENNSGTVGGGFGFVTTGYTQNGVNNLSQSISANQFRIVNNGVLNLENGNPSLNSQTLGAYTIASTTFTHLFIVCNANDNDMIFENVSGNNFARFRNLATDEVSFINQGTNVNAYFSGGLNFGSQILLEIDTVNNLVYVNGVSQDNTISLIAFITNNFFGRSSAQTPLVNVQELHLFNQSSLDRTEIVDNINSHYNIY